MKQKNPKVKWILNQTGIIVEPFESFEETFEERPPEEQLRQQKLIEGLDEV